MTSHSFDGRRFEFIHISCTTRINTQTYFQQHAGRRMTPKTVDNNLNRINRAQIERRIQTDADEAQLVHGELGNNGARSLELCRVRESTR